MSRYGFPNDGPVADTHRRSERNGTSAGGANGRVLPFPGRPRAPEHPVSGIRREVPEVGMGAYADSMEAMGRLAGRVASHLNELLEVVDRNTSSMGEALEDGQGARELQEIRDAYGRASELSEKLLSISGCRRSEPRIVDLRTLVSEMKLGRSFSDDVLYCTDFAVVTCPVNVDPTHLEELVLELVRNAREAVGERGTVRVGIDHLPGATIDGSRRMGWVQLEVSDSGKGMDWETLTHAFQPFFTTRASAEDRGLGLAACCGILRQSGGTMKVYSAPGSGTTVRVWLPAAASVSASDRGLERGGAPETRSATVL